MELCWMDEEEVDKRIERQRDIDRAMQWCEEYLRANEICDEIHNFPIEISIDHYIATCVRYLEKVESEI